MKTIRLMFCLPMAALSGCLTLPEIRDATSKAGVEVSYRIPEPACEEGRTEMARVLVNRPRTGVAAASLQPTLDAMSGDPATEVGKIMTAMLAPKQFQTRDADNAKVVISRKGLREQIQAAQNAAQEGAFRRAGVEGFDLYERYFESYFRKGRFINAGLSKTAALERLKQDLRNGLNLSDDTALPADQQKVLDDAAKALVDLLCKSEPCNLLKADEDAAFVNRAGQKFGFPVVTFVVKPGSAKGYELTKIDEVQVVGDLTRVFWEATFDVASKRSGLRLAADSKATACVAPALAHFDCIKPSEEKKQKEELAPLNLVADRTEGVAGFIAAQLVRGAYFFSLDNEAMAKLFQTSISVSARKAAELAYAANKQCRSPESFRTVSFVLVE
jgi:hypothetical protein